MIPGGLVGLKLMLKTSSVCEVSLDDRLELVSLTFAVQCVWSSHPPPPVQQEHGGQGGGGGGDHHPLLTWQYAEQDYKSISYLTAP